jgi:hypothetical protein
MCYYFVSPVEHKGKTKSGIMVFEQYAKNLLERFKDLGVYKCLISL